MKLNRAIIVLFLILYSFLLIVFMANSISGSYRSQEEGILGSGYVQIFLIFLSLFFILVNSNTIKNIPNVFSLGLIFMFGTLLSLLFSGDEIVSNIYRVIGWYFLFLVGFISSYVNKEDRSLILRWMILVVLSSVVYLYVSTVLLSSSYNFVVFDASLLIVIMLPFVLTLNSKSLKMFFVIVIGFIAFFSIKRSTMLAFILGMMIYNFFNLKKNKILFTFLGLFLIGALTYLVYLFTDQQTGGYVSQRLDHTLEEGGSSGRDEIYLNVWSNILDADIVNFLFGHGNYATKNDFGVFAHNDYLEIIYDYGIFLFITYVLMVRSLFLFGIRLKKENNIPSHEIAAYFVSLVLLVFLGMLNVIILNPQYFGTAMFFIGLQMGYFYQIKMRKRFLFSTNVNLIK